jgi:hypothetical protein
MSGRMIVLGLIVWVVACAGSSKSPGAPTSNGGPLVGSASCQDLTAEAVGILNAAAVSVAQCTVGADCKSVPIPVDCLSSCVTVIGNDAVRGAVAAKAAALASVCDRFHEQGCQVSEGGCPAPPYAYACQASRCVGN